MSRIYYSNTQQGSCNVLVHGHYNPGMDYSHDVTGECWTGCGAPATIVMFDDNGKCFAGYICDKHVSERGASVQNKYKGGQSKFYSFPLLPDIFEFTIDDALCNGPIDEPM